VAGLFLQETIMNMNTKRNIDAATVREAARGRWIEILAALAPELDNALSKPGRHVGCPVHGGKDGFRLFKDVDLSGGGVCNSCGPYSDGFALIRWLKDVDFPSALSLVNDVALGSSYMVPKPVRKPVQPCDRQAGESVKYRLNEMWRQAFDPLSIKSDLLWGYLESRGLRIHRRADIRNLRLHPGLKSFNEDGRYEGSYPCILALVQNTDGLPVTLHRTYITHEGTKAPVQSAKKMMPIIPGGRVQGAACRLTKGSTSIGVCEGIETALAVWLATGMAVWPCLNAALLGMFEPPPGVRLVWIWGDRDANLAGQKATAQLKEKLDLSGVENSIWIPSADLLPHLNSGKSTDWLDVLTELGPHAFPLAIIEPYKYNQAA